MANVSLTRKKQKLKLKLKQKKTKIQKKFAKNNKNKNKNKNKINNNRKKNNQGGTTTISNKNNINNNDDNIINNNKINATTQKNMSFKKLNCSPKPNKLQVNSFSCYTNDTLQKMRALWNQRHPDVKLESTDPKEIHMFLEKQMKEMCNNEACWLKESKIFPTSSIENIISESFAPEMPIKWKANPHEWLSSVEINKVMRQYEKAYPCFEFIGPSPIDFDTKLMGGECVWKELCHFQIEKQLQKKKTKIGIIINTDTHDKSGEHWISMFINIKKGRIFFFDSVGTTAPPEIRALVDRILEQGKKLSPPIDFKYDENHPVEHQYKNTECGIYSIFFIVHLLEDKLTENYFKTHVLKDEYMHKFRNTYFNETLHS